MKLSYPATKVSATIGKVFVYGSGAVAIGLSFLIWGGLKAYAAISVILLVVVASIVFFEPLFLVSVIDGRLHRSSGEPGANVRMVRTWDWALTGRKGQQETVTDAEGCFHFPAVKRRSLLARVLPHEPSIRQTIAVEGMEGEVVIFSAQKSNYEENGELQGTPLQVLCGIDGLPGPENRRIFSGQCILVESDSESM